MSVKFTKEEADRIINIEGNVRLATFNTYYSFIFDIKGKEGVEAVEKKLKEVGYPMDLEGLYKGDSLKWVPQAQGCLILVAILDYLGWEEKDAQKIGYFLSATTFFTKLIIKYIISPEKTFKESAKLWKRHYAFSELELIESNLEKKYVVFRINNFKKFHLALYYSIGGYIVKIVEMATGSKKTNLELTKCIFWNDPYDEIKITWE
ncbi:MAG: hypothetical protein PHI88_02995 [Candidatus Pacebacteria bacterium]|nr:hypothetical protein [Candidatus Paceibacterota bacterium]